MKIFIFGIVASGKTTLAKSISKEYNIPCYEGDCIAWAVSKERRYKRSDIEQKQEIDRINSQGEWIIEGTYRESQRCIFDMADKIIFLDTPLWIGKIRIVTRFIKQKLGIEKCHYKSDMKMLKLMFKWTKEFERDRNRYETILNSYQDKLVIIKSAKELKTKWVEIL